MKQMISSFSHQLREGWRLGVSVNVLPLPTSKVNIIGMGGSALPGDFLRSYSDGIEVTVHRDYGYGKAFDDGLNVCISYSGNTEETVAALKEISGKGRPCVAMSCGGKIMDLARERSIPHVKLPEGLVPRLALPLMSSALMGVCHSAGMLPSQENEIERAAASLDPAENSSIGLRIALSLQDRIPLFYASARNEIVAKVGKIAVNENAKTQAFYNVIPELNHNEMNGFDIINGRFVALFYYDPEDHQQNIKRMQLTQALLEERAIRTVTVEMTGVNRLGKLMGALQTQFWASYHLANYYGVDPVSVPVVEQFKKQL
ncbi:MAG: hypothetical protein N3H30_02485 [Candidatus Micrarchaeota archaeon]|nr:hypothetical protein [Candidatus Micrarchaeota archaeon]